MCALASLEASVKESIIESALCSEALYTLLLGQPAMCSFSWSCPSLAADLLRLGAISKEGKTGGWLADLLVRLFPTTAWPPGSKLPAFLFRVFHCGPNRFFGEPKEKPVAFTIYCINLDTLEESGLKKSIEDKWASLIGMDVWALAAHEWLTHSMHRVHVSATIDDPFSWVTASIAAMINNKGRPMTSMWPLFQPTHAERMVLVPEDSPETLLAVVPCSPMGYGRERSDVIVSTPTVDGKYALLGWFHPLDCERLSEAELRIVQQRAALREALICTRKTYNGRSWQLLMDWTGADANEQFPRDMHVAVRKARFLSNQIPINCDPLHAGLKSALARPNTPQYLEQLLRGRTCTINRQEHDRQIESLWFTLARPHYISSTPVAELRQELDAGVSDVLGRNVVVAVTLANHNQWPIGAFWSVLLVLLGDPSRLKEFVEHTTIPPVCSDYDDYPTDLYVSNFMREVQETPKGSIADALMHMFRTRQPMPIASCENRADKLRQLVKQRPDWFEHLSRWPESDQ